MKWWIVEAILYLCAIVVALVLLEMAVVTLGGWLVMVSYVL